jgi:hypothetical protein
MGVPEFGPPRATALVGKQPCLTVARRFKIPFFLNAPEDIHQEETVMTHF